MQHTHVKLTLDTQVSLMFTRNPMTASIELNPSNICIYSWSAEQMTQATQSFITTLLAITVTAACM
jgi:hypothetical protein